MWVLRHKKDRQRVIRVWDSVYFPVQKPNSTQQSCDPLVTGFGERAATCVCAGWKFPKYRYEISRFKEKRQTSYDILVSAILFEGSGGPNSYLKLSLFFFFGTTTAPSAGTFGFFRRFGCEYCKWERRDRESSKSRAVFSCRNSRRGGVILSAWYFFETADNRNMYHLDMFLKWRKGAQWWVHVKVGEVLL
jgi:hypothetical protein